MTELGIILTRLRQEKGIGQKELSAHLNLSIGTISNYENSIHSPDLNTLHKLADYFGVTTDYLLGRTEYRCPPETLAHYFTTDYTVSDIVDVILSLDDDQRNSAVSYLSYLKETSDRNSNQQI